MKEWLSLLESLNCFWFESSPKDFHALLSGGSHSNGYINIRNLVRYRPSVLKNMVIDFFFHHKKHLLQVFDREGIDYVHGPAMGGVIPSYELALLLKIGIIYTEKQDNEMICNFDELEGKNILLTEDVLTTGKTCFKSKKVLIERGANIVGPLCVLLNRSGQDFLDGQEILSLVALDIKTYAPEECPWCKSGSKPVKPKLLWKTFSS